MTAQVVTRGRTPVVLCYHAVSESWDDDLAVPLRRLEEQLRGLLRRGYHSVTAEELLERDPRSFHVTFDDAYRSVGRAIPILEELGIAATVFACPAYADDGRPLDVPELSAEAAAHPAELATMGWDDLRALTARGVEIGSHTMTHAHLTRLNSEELNRELRQSRLRLQDELGLPCRFLAYPYGEHDARVRAAARDAGYEAAFALPGDPGDLDRFAVPRVGIWRFDGRLRTFAKTSIAARWLAPLLRSRTAAPLRRLTGGTTEPREPQRVRDDD